MLRQRIVTALVLLALLLPAMFYPLPEPFCALALLFIAAAAWEWGRLNGEGMAGAVVLALACVAACAASWALGWLQRPLPLLWSLAGLAWVLGGGMLLRAGVPGWSRLAQPLRLLAGIAVLWLAWLAMAQARVRGINFVLSVLVLVWVADISAYAAGRAFGKHKLAPAISPGKSWEGVAGGMLGVLLLALLWVWADRATQAATPSLYTGLAAQSWWLLPLGALFLAAMSVVGDLLESLLKRSAGVKDSSALLPGHGGVLDRIDALLPTLPLALMLGGVRL
jgi:phosphatidate cytidylyltransferase